MCAGSFLGHNLREISAGQIIRKEAIDRDRIFNAAWYRSVVCLRNRRRSRYLNRIPSRRPKAQPKYSIIAGLTPSFSCPKPISLLSIPITIATPTPVGFLFANSYSEKSLGLRLVVAVELHICACVFRNHDAGEYTCFLTGQCELIPKQLFQLLAGRSLSRVDFLGQ